MHGFFALMGGFMLFDGDKAIRILRPDELRALKGAHNGFVRTSRDENLLLNTTREETEFPHITKKDIEDRSQGDLLSKAVLCIQTAWFMLKLIGRSLEHLPITELELVTLAFVSLNFTIYAYWWEKPFNVQIHFRVHRKGNCRVNGEGEVEAGRCGTEIETENEDNREGEGEDGQRRGADTLHKTAWWVSVFERWILRPILVFGKMGGIGEDDLEINTRRIPTFYAGRLTDIEVDLVAFAGAFIATLFGAVHCIGWNFIFPSHAEQYLWRLSSLVTTCTPVLMLATFWISNAIPPNRLTFLPHLTSAIYVTCAAVHISSRVFLLVVTITSLRALPPGAYVEVSWPDIIPHIA